MKKFILLSTLVFGLFFTNTEISSAQCAMCKSSIESNQKLQGNNRVVAFNAGILYLMIIPYILFGTLGYFWYKNSKKEKTERARIDAVLKKAIG
ncbi:MAG: hypothetical protein SFY32_06265 [Bacteroidota bacterium]|nr:hypothetical protein [Bacteroidota bacterium]